MSDRDLPVLRDDGTRIVTAGERRDVRAADRAEPRDQRRLRIPCDIPDRGQPEAREHLARRVADAPQARHRQRVEEREHAVGRHDAQAVGLVDVRSDLRGELDRRDTDGRDEGQLGAHALLDRGGDRRAIAEQALAPRAVEERLVEREAFDVGREVAEDAEERARRGDVPVHVVTNDDRLGAPAQRLCHRHRARDAERARLVGARRDHATARGSTDEHGLLAQRWIVPLLDRRVERVEVDVQDRAGHSIRTGGASPSP